nr:hypothetical protein HK105_003324 [Polyrhizophydium stewartii]
MRLNVILFVARSAQAADSGQSSDEAVPAGDDGCWWAAKTPLLAVAAPRARVSSLPELLRGLWAEVRQQCGKNVFELADSMVIRNAAGSIIPQSLFVADAFEDGERITATVALAGGAPRERRASHRTEGSKRQARHSALPSPRKRLRADSHAHTAHRHADSDEPSSDSAGSDDGLGETAPWRNGKAKSVLHESQDILRLPAADGSVADTNIDSDAAEAAEISHVFETSNGNLPADDAAGRSDGERVPETENEDGSDGEAESPTAAESHNADADREAQAARPNSDPERDSASSEAYSTYSVPAGLAARATGSRSRENTSEIPSVHSKGEKGTLRCCDVANVDTYPLNADVGEGTGLRQSADQSSAAAADAHAIVDGDQESSGDANSADGETKGVEVGAAATNGFEPRSVIENVTSPAADTDSDPEAEDDAESESDTPAALAADPRRGSIRGGANAEDEDEEPMASSSDDAAQDDVDGAEAEAEDDGDDDGADTEAEDEADEAIDESQDRPELEDEPETQRQAEGAEEFEYEHQTSQESPSLYSQPLFPMTQSITRRSPPPPSKLLAAIDRASSTNRQPPPNRSRSFASLSELASSFQPPSQASQASKPAKIAAEDDEDESSNDEDESSNDDDDDDDDDGSDSSDDGPSIKLAGKKPKKRKSLLMELAKDGMFV